VEVRFDGEPGEPLVWRFVRMDKYSVNGAKRMDRERGEFPKKKAKRKLKACTAVGL
jgi:hypothetical protein